MSVADDAENYVESRVNEIEDNMLDWFGLDKDDITGECPEVRVSSDYQVPTYSTEDDLVGVSEKYISQNSEAELDMALAEEVTHRAYHLLNPEEEASNRSEFFGRLGYLKQAYDHGEEVDELTLDKTSKILESIKNAENKADKKDEELDELSDNVIDNVPSVGDFNDTISGVRKDIENKRYSSAESALMYLAENTEDLSENVAGRLENAAKKLGDGDQNIKFNLETAKMYYKKDHKFTSSESFLGSSRVVGLENIRQHLSYAFADRYFEDIDDMSSSERSELISEPDMEKIADLIEEDEDMKKFLNDNEELVEQYIKL